MGYGREDDRDDQNQAIRPKGERNFIHSLKSIRSSPIFQPMNRNMMYNLSEERKYLKTLLSKIEVSPQSRGVPRGMILLFGGERPPNKKALFYVRTGITRTPIARICNFESIPGGRECMIRSTSPDRIIRTFPQRSLRLEQVMPWCDEWAVNIV